MSEQTPGLTALPDDAILVHIGTHKTGTTALQADLRRLRGSLAAHGVTVPITSVRAHNAGRALLGGERRGEARHSKRERQEMWATYAREVRSHPGRVVISCETFCQANEAQARQLVEDLGADRVRVIVAFRPLGTLLASSWQQYLKGGFPESYEDWLAAVLADPPRAWDTPSFWHRNDVPGLLSRWGSVIDPERLTTVIIESPADMKVRRAMEAFLSLPSGLIAPTAPQSRSNRSLTLAESELLLKVNMASRRKVPAADYLRFVRYGAVPRMVAARSPDPGEARLGLPEWAVPRIKEIGNAHAEWLRESGFRVLGSPDALVEVVARETGGDPGMIPTEAAALAVLGALRAASAGSSKAVPASSAPRVLPSRRKVKAQARRVARRLRLG